MKQKYTMIAVDIQNDFASPGGKWYTPKKSVAFLKKTLFPFLHEQNIKLNEVVADYRSPRPGKRDVYCCPGEWGYESLVPKDLKKGRPWVKSMNSPIWIRKNAGKKNINPGLPSPAPEKFGRWLAENIGAPDSVVPVVFGLTIDCCVLSTLQELSWRGYAPLVLREGVDAASGKISDRNGVLRLVIPNWAKVITWPQFRKIVLSCPACFK
jgi:hypothetical protein